MQKIILWTITIFLLLVGGFFTLNNFIYQEKQADPNEGVERYEATLSGEYVCLPHTDQTGPQTLECALGIQTEVGEYYAVDFTTLSDSDTWMSLATGDQITVTGEITPIELLSTDAWQKYAVEGIFQVQSVTKE